MVEIVFSESACGSLKIAQTYGRGKYRGSAISVFIRHENGSVPSSNEMKEAPLQAQEQECIAWENAIPLGGKSSDVYCFDMALSVGDISDNGIGEQRKNVFTYTTRLSSCTGLREQENRKRLPILSPTRFTKENVFYL